MVIFFFARGYLPALLSQAPRNFTFETLSSTFCNNFSHQGGCCKSTMLRNQ